MPSDPKAALSDILEHIILARRWTKGITLYAFVTIELELRP
jgi:uncharacterized protein with HEPN domain